MTNPDTTRMVFTIPKDLKRRLGEYTLETGVSQSEVIRKALSEYLSTFSITRPKEEQAELRRDRNRMKRHRKKKR